MCLNDAMKSFPVFEREKSGNKVAVLGKLCVSCFLYFIYILRHHFHYEICHAR